MARKTAPTVDVARTPLELRAAAIRRVQARRRPPRYGEIPDGRGGTFRWQLDNGGGPIADPQDLGEWLDDRIARTPAAEGACDTLIQVFELLRGGVDAVPGAISFAADRLRDPHQQWGAWMVLSSLPGGLAGIESLKAQITRQWRRRGLQDQPPPAAPFGADPFERDRASEQSKHVVYRTPLGHNAA